MSTAPRAHSDDRPQPGPQSGLGESLSPSPLPAPCRDPPPTRTHTHAHALPAGAPQGQLAQVFLLVSLRFVLSTYIFTHLTNYNMNSLQKKKKTFFFNDTEKYTTNSRLPLSGGPLPASVSIDLSQRRPEKADPPIANSIYRPRAVKLGGGTLLSCLPSFPPPFPLPLPSLC